MSMDKIRIYELAKKLKLSNKEVMDMLADKLHIEVKSHASTIDSDDADKLIGIIKAAKSPEKKQPAPQEKSPEIKQEKPIVQEKKPQTPPPPHRTEPQKPQQGSFQQQRPFNQGGRPDHHPRPQGERPDNRPPHQGERSGNRPPYQGERPDNRPPYQGRDNRFPPRNDGQRFPDRGPRNFPDRNTPRPGGDGSSIRTYENSRDAYRPQPRKPFEQRPDGTRPPRPDNRPDGQRPPRPDNRFEGQRFPSGNRPDGQRPPRPDNRPDFPPRKPAASKETPVEPSKTPGRREIFGKKKDNKYSGKEGVLSKEEKLEQLKLAQDKFKKKKKEEKPEVKEKVTEVTISKPLTAGELAEKLDLSVADVVKQLMMSGILATVNQTIDVATAESTAEKLGFTIIKAETETEKEAEQKTESEVEKVDESKLSHRAPVVTIMGHVDHGKTTLLDAIRAIRHKIVNTEVGGITQSIGAYSVRVNEKKVVFLDTPGHEAFTAMRARGAQATDIAILVVAADDGIMPQTIEAINHAKAAKVPIIVAVNKIDKADADPDKVLQQLTEYDLVPEKWGGDTVCVPVSALQGTNIDELLEMILLVAEVEEYKAEHDTKATGVIIEAKLDKGKGAVATLLVQSGTLYVGDYIVTGMVGGKVRALISDEGERITSAGPSTPVEVLGLTEVPQAGDRFEVVGSDKAMKNIISDRKEEEKLSRFEQIAPAQIRKEMILQDQEQAKDLNIIIKANTHGSAEAVSAALQQLVSKQIFVKLIHVGVGDISEADVILASASNAIIIGFSVKEDQNALKAASNTGVDIRKYDIIYQIIEDIEKTMLGLLQPETKEVEIGTAEVRQVFTIGKSAKIAGCYVLDGKIIRNKNARVVRNGKEIYKGAIDQLKRFKDDVKEVASGYECGIMFNKFNDIQEGDLIKVLTIEEIEREVLV